MMRNKGKIIAVATGLALLVSCSMKEEKTTATNPGNALFNEQKALLTAYIDSLKHLPDSVNVESLMERYQELVLAINMKYPADTDLSLSEGQNEALYKLTDKLIKLAGKHGVSPDSISAVRADSLKISENNPVE